MGLVNRIADALFGKLTDEYGEKFDNLEVQLQAHDEKLDTLIAEFEDDEPVTPPTPPEE